MNNFLQIFIITFSDSSGSVDDLEGYSDEGDGLLAFAYAIYAMSCFPEALSTKTNGKHCRVRHQAGALVFMSFELHGWLAAGQAWGHAYLTLYPLFCQSCSGYENHEQIMAYNGYMDGRSH